jgi:hypothetical protein
LGATPTGAANPSIPAIVFNIVAAGTPGCPAIPIPLAWGTIREHRMNSGVIAAFPLQSPQGTKASIAFTQGQQAATPAGPITEFSISKCPGVIDTTVPQCYYRNTTININQITVYTKPVYTWASQATLGNRGCWAPASEGPWYVNVRWTYATCPASYTRGCGFSVQWTPGPY